MSIQFPNVPQLPGVPPLARQAAAFATRVIAGVSIIGQLLSQSSQSAAIWGVFDANNNKVLSPDTIRGLEYGEEWRVASYPVQPNAFTSYDRVQLPFEVVLTMRKTGAITDRQRFMNQIVAMRQSTQLYTIITPELVYSGLTFARWGQNRKDGAGAYTIEVELVFQKINSGTAAYSTTQNAAAPSAQPNAAQGTVTTAPVPPSVQTQVTGAPP